VRRDPIVICPYDPSWPESFERQRDQIAPLLGGWITRPIEHIGSTAVAGLPAKNIIDMLVVVDDIHGEPRAVDLLSSVGWLHAPEPHDAAERRLSFCLPTLARRTHHLHVVEENSGDWRGWLAFRDYLRSHDDDAAAYAALKSELARDHGQDPNEREAYRGGKAAFIQTTTAKALRESRPGPDSN
jgi:GrpB-like predicted nucleotidyltransferase (UPF0157 family)